MRKKRIRKLLALLGAAVLAVCSFAGCGGEKADENVLYVYNYGEYLDPEAIDLFEEEYGVRVVYDEFETNEVMYPKVSAHNGQYDVVCASDYMIKKLILNDLIQPLDWEELPTAKENTGEVYLEMSEGFDPGNQYAVPYTWGTVGILYDPEMTGEEIDSWEVLWDPKYTDDILMQDSVRDLFGVALKYLGYSLNTTDIGELEEARDLLIAQKPIVQAYIMDEVRDKMIAGESAIGVIYSGEAEEALEGNENLLYVIPKEGTNIWVDSWVVTKEAAHRNLAYQWIEFMCRPEIALMNFEYIWYSTPNVGLLDLLDEETLENETLFPHLEEYENLEALDYLGEEAEALYFELWKEVKSA